MFEPDREALQRLEQQLREREYAIRLIEERVESTRQAYRREHNRRTRQLDHREATLTEAEEAHRRLRGECESNFQGAQRDPAYIFGDESRVAKRYEAMKSACSVLHELVRTAPPVKRFAAAVSRIFSFRKRPTHGS
jgi:hypothetical protein